MNPQYEKLTEKVMEWVGNAAQQIGDFASKEVPPFITEYLTWKFWEGVVHIGGYIFVEVLLVIVALGMFKLAQIGWRKYKENGNGDFDVMGVAATVAGCCLTAISIIHLFAEFPTQSLMDCIQIKIAPKVYLVEKAAALYKSSK